MEISRLNCTMHRLLVHHILFKNLFSKYGGPNTFEIWLMKDQGGPWVSGTTATIMIQTEAAQGDITVTLP
jgi:hypothetical protein